MDKRTNMPNIKVLMYHRVLDKKPAVYNHWHYVTVPEFTRQMKMIDRLGYTTITFSDYQLYLDDKLTLPAKPIIITFDDGYLDTFENAIPVMQRLNMRGVIFALGNRKLKTAQWDEKGKDDICPLMSDKHLKISKDLGFEIGAHSLNHRELVELTDGEVTDEIINSRVQIESIIQEPVITFAYPYGSVDERVKQIAFRAGYLFACGVYTGSPKFGNSVYDFRRIAINQYTTPLNFALKILSPYEYFESYYHYMKTRMGTLRHSQKKGLTIGAERMNGKSNPSKSAYKDMKNSKYM